MRKIFITIACFLLSFTLSAQEPLMHNGYEYVDMGLSVMWATCNLGATKSTGYGRYFAWAETTVKGNYDWSSLKYCSDSDGEKFTKYVNDPAMGTVDDKMRLEESDDAARVLWGGEWRIPTQDEVQELIDSCKWQWVTNDGYMGYTVTATNGHTIYLPASGYMEDSFQMDRNLTGAYSTSDADPDPCSYVFCLNIDREDHSIHSFLRSNGFTIRPVFTMPVPEEDTATE